MVFTARFLLLLAGAPILLALMVWWPVAGILALAYAVAALVMLVVDFRSIRLQEVRFTREIFGDLSVAVPNTYSIEVQNASDQTMRGELREWLPASFERARDRVALTLAPNETLVHEIQVRPMRRGSYASGPLYVRVVGRQGLAEVRRQVLPAQPIEVIPDLLATRQHELRLKRGLIRQQGNRQVRMSGRGGEFESLRAYTQDDDIRHIDWRATARKGKPLTRQYQPETRQRIILAMDLGRLMLGRYGDLAKVDAVLNCSVYVANAAIRAGDAVGYIGFSDELKARLSVKAGARQVKLLLRAITPLNAEPVETDYRILARELGAVERRRAMVVLFADFVDETQIEDLLQALTAVRHRHRVVVAAVRDAEMFALASCAPKDAKEAFASAAASHILLQRAAAIRRLERLGILVLDVSQQDLSVRVVEQYLRLREQATL